MQRLCPRCHYAVTLEDENTLVYCGHCGAPQIRLSEDLLAQADSAREGTDSTAAQSRPLDLTAVNWQGAIRCAALAGAVAFAFSLLSLVAPPLGLLALFWAVGAPIVTLGIYASRFRQTRIFAGFGARLGLLTGMAVTLGMASVNTGGMLVQRYITHTTHIDAQIAALFEQFRASSLQQSGAAAQPFLALFDIPEFRAGFLLSSLALFIVMYLAFSAAGGAFAGLLRARNRSV